MKYTPKPTNGQVGGERGDSLIEVLASVVLMGLIVVGVSQWTSSATRWVNQGRNEAQALSYARQGVELVRTIALAAYKNGTPLAAVTPPALAQVRGVTYTETINGPVTPAWDNDRSTVAVQEYTVRVSWSGPEDTAADHVSLTAVVDPAVARL